MSAAICFPRATNRVNAVVVEKLAPFLVALKQNASSRILLEGHADRISQIRADAVKKYLLSKGVEESRIEVQAKGDEAPVDPPGDSWRNRCVIVRLEQMRVPAH